MKIGPDQARSAALQGCSSAPGRPKGLRYLSAAIALCCASVVLVAQGGGGLDPALLLKPLADSWPSYSGDYTGRRHTALTQVNQANVKNLTLAFTARVTGGPGSGRSNPDGPQTYTGGEG